ncbi:translation elongation factor Ts [Gulosibacter molinativorax]|uniref:Elongation factor Ts n=1 Tax=Gulosibacter molinativorax TaxID=256821 RepID=A0ABT7CC53_9MICO|nr:translation elongation factor Ts [Gulosibacter molinativorax]MDJ1372737.1 elongation factor Ts [Gulosibacter molinativorax]QUY60755.1 Elongation factor Ts [Gulosibacter molinativorax]
MANFTIADVKALREQLGTGLTDTKKALDEADGDMDKAIELLRLKGAKGNAKRADRSAAEGLIAAKDNGNGTATIIELNCETDFVAKGEKFIDLANQVLEAAAAAGATNAAEALAAPAGDQTVAELIDGVAAVIGEKFELRNVRSVKGEKFDIYMHLTSKDLPPQVGVVVGYEGGDEETAHGIAQHIAFANPSVLNREDVSEEDIARERKVVEDLTRAEGKPEAALPKIVEGRLGAYFKQIVLNEQEYARDPKHTVAQIAEQAGLKIADFARLKVGVGVEASEEADA